MSARKKPILLRRSLLTGRVNALTSYRWVNDGETLEAAPDGKHDVTADFDAILMGILLDPAPSVAYLLDKAIHKATLDDDEALELARFREALVTVIERHNEGPHVAPSKKEKG